MTHAVCILSVIPVRKDPDDTAEIVTQLLFGEYLEILATQEQWRKIKCHHDGYEGWIDEKQIQPVEESTWQRLKSFPSERLILSSLPIVTPEGEVIEVLKGSELSGLLHKESKWNHGYKLLNDNNKKPAMVETAYAYLNSPYLWGGRNPFGIDCSGLTQVVMSFYDIHLPRDAKDQEKLGQKVLFENKQPGDLAFFINKKGKVHHVGMIMENRQIIHASGKVRIDHLTTEGIIHSESEDLTHQLISIKRY